MKNSDSVIVAALGDVHYGKNSQGSLQPLFWSSAGT
jgi:hypothetical protein